MNTIILTYYRVSIYLNSLIQSFLPAHQEPVTMTVDDYYIELCTDTLVFVHVHVAVFNLLHYHLCISGMQAEALLPVVTHLSKNCEDHNLSMNNLSMNIQSTFLC